MSLSPLPVWVTFIYRTGLLPGYGIAAQPWGHIVSSVVDRDPNVLNLDPDPGFWPNFDPNPGFCFKF